MCSLDEKKSNTNSERVKNKHKNQTYNVFCRQLRLVTNDALWKFQCWDAAKNTANTFTVVFPNIWWQTQQE
jgi:hypothetical protein